jgi:hypothetical protein
VSGLSAFAMPVERKLQSEVVVATSPKFYFFFCPNYVFKHACFVPKMWAKLCKDHNLSHRFVKLYTPGLEILSAFTHLLLLFTQRIFIPMLDCFCYFQVSMYK